MRYRALSSTGDMTFGQGSANFLVNSPAAVAQAVLTKLRLWTGEWFLDTTEGTPWDTQVLGKGTTSLYDLVIQNRIRATPGVIGISGYSSGLNIASRQLTFLITELVTAYGSTSVNPPNSTVPLPPGVG